MAWLDKNVSGALLFAGYFILYGLEYLVPLVPRRSRHLLTNMLLAAVLVTLNIACTSLTFAISDWVAQNDIGLFNLVTVPHVVEIIVTIVALDFWTGYVAHVVFHRYGWLWRFHIVHHTDDLVDVTTAFRQHPAESFIRVLFNLSGMVLLGIPEWMLLIYLTLSTVNAQLEHANIRLPEKLDRLLQYIIVTPNMHKVHHSRFQQETDSNFSNIFSVWDRLFGTYKHRNDYTNIAYGLDVGQRFRPLNFGELMALPFTYYKRDKKKKRSKVVYPGHSHPYNRGMRWHSYHKRRKRRRASQTE